MHPLHDPAGHHESSEESLSRGIDNAIQEHRDSQLPSLAQRIVDEKTPGALAAQHARDAETQRCRNLARQLSNRAAN